MLKYIFIFFVTGILFFSCGKKNDPVVQKDTPKQNSQNQTQTQKELPAMVDFNWKESGKEFKLSDYKGKVIVLNFWATWCGPCKREIPALSQIHSELKDKDFKLIGVSVDDNKDDLADFLKVNNLPYTVVHEPDQLVQKYMNLTGQNQNVVPQTYIINKEGKVVETILGARSKADFIGLINKYL